MKALSRFEQRIGPWGAFALWMLILLALVDLCQSLGWLH